MRLTLLNGNTFLSALCTALNILLTHKAEHILKFLASVEGTNSVSLINYLVMYHLSRHASDDCRIYAAGHKQPPNRKFTQIFISDYL